MDPEYIEVTIDRGVLTISAKRAEEDAEGDVTRLMDERMTLNAIRWVLQLEERVRDSRPSAIPCARP